MRLIDAKAFQKRILDMAIAKNLPIADVSNALYLIEKQPTVTEQESQDARKWTPVTERLPEDKVNPITRDAYVYPVTVDLGGATDIRYYSFCRGHWYNQGPKEMDELVIAWQERPEPYKPE